jgi:hypothetical protein
MQHLAAALRHDYEPGRKRDQAVHYTPLFCSWIAQNGMEGRDNRHSQLAQERQNVTTGGSAENAEFVLQADEIDVADVQEIRRA